MRAFAVCSLLLLPWLSAPLHAAQPESRYTSIENKDCKFDPVGKEPGDAEDQRKTCAGLGGARIIVNSYHARLRIGFVWSQKRNAGPEDWVVDAWSAGFKIEWRGSKTAKGFEPYAATVRMILPDDRTGKAGTQVLAVMRMAPRKACLMGAVDISANKNGYELARALADKAPGFACGQDKPRIAGIETEAAKDIVGRDE